MDSVIEIHGKKFELYINADSIAQRITEIASALKNDFSQLKPVFLGVLNGSFMFFSDLMKQIEFECEMEFVKTVSYHGTQSTGKVKDIFGVPQNLENRNIIIIEDVIDTGLTMKYLVDELQTLKPQSISICTLLLKPEAIKEEIPEIKHIGFSIPNEFVVGYGLDYDGLGRNLTEIYKAGLI